MARITRNAILTWGHTSRSRRLTEVIHSFRRVPHNDQQKQQWGSSIVARKRARSCLQATTTALLQRHVCAAQKTRTCRSYIHTGNPAAARRSRDAEHAAGMWQTQPQHIIIPSSSSSTRSRRLASPLKGRSQDGSGCISYSEGGFEWTTLWLEDAWLYRY